MTSGGEGNCPRFQCSFLSYLLNITRIAKLPLSREYEIISDLLIRVVLVLEMQSISEMYEIAPQSREAAFPLSYVVRRFSYLGGQSISQILLIASPAVRFSGPVVQVVLSCCQILVVLRPTDEFCWSSQTSSYKLWQPVSDEHVRLEALWSC